MTMTQFSSPRIDARVSDTNATHVADWVISRRVPLEQRARRHSLSVWHLMPTRVNSLSDPAATAASLSPPACMLRDCSFLARYVCTVWPSRALTSCYHVTAYQLTDAHSQSRQLHGDNFLSPSPYKNSRTVCFLTVKKR